MTVTSFVQSGAKQFGRAADMASQVPKRWGQQRVEDCLEWGIMSSLYVHLLSAVICECYSYDLEGINTLVGCVELVGKTTSQTPECYWTLILRKTNDWLSLSGPHYRKISWARGHCGRQWTVPAVSRCKQPIGQTIQVSSWFVHVCTIVVQ